MVCLSEVQAPISQNSWNKAWRVLSCAVVGAGLELVIVLTGAGGALAAPCGAAIWTITAVEGTTALTAAECSALAVASATSAAAGAHFGNARGQQSHNSHGKKNDQRDVHRASEQQDVWSFLCPKKAAKWQRQAGLEPMSIRRHRQGPIRQTTVDQNCANSMVATTRLLLNRMCTYLESSQS